MDSYAMLAETIPNEDVDLVRELLSYDSLCPIAATFVRDHLGQLIREYTPSPLHWSRQVEWPWAIRAGELAPEHRVLEVGGGWSVLKYAVANRCKHLYSLEVNTEFIARTQSSIDKLGLAHKITQVPGDARKLPFMDDTFDRVFCISVLEHIEENRELALSEMIRVLKPGGALLLTMDAAIKGGGDGDFHLTLGEAGRLLSTLGLTVYVKPVVIGATLEGGKVEIVVVMIRYIKGSQCEPSKS